MPKVLSRALRRLAQWYQTPGGTVAPASIDFAAPIVVTHSVDRLVEVNQGIIIASEVTMNSDGLGSYDRASVTVQSIMANASIADLLLELGVVNKGLRTEIDMYLLGISAQLDPASVGNIGGCMIGVEGPIHDEIVAGSGRTYPIYFANTVLPANIRVTGFDGDTFMASNGLGAFLSPHISGHYDTERHPIGGLTIVYRDNSGGVTTAEFVFRLALMVRNARPRP